MYVPHLKIFLRSVSADYMCSFFLCSSSLCTYNIVELTQNFCYFGVPFSSALRALGLEVTCRLSCCHRCPSLEMSCVCCSKCIFKGMAVLPGELFQNKSSSTFQPQWFSPLYFLTFCLVPNVCDMNQQVFPELLLSSLMER